MRWLAFSQTTGYALKIMSVLCASDGDWKRAEDISRETGIPFNYLSKILNQLGKRGFVIGQKGWGGGFMLSKTAKDRPIREIVELFEGDLEFDACIFGLSECDSASPCSMHASWEPVKRAFTEMLNELKIADICDRGEAAGVFETR